MKTPRRKAPSASQQPRGEAAANSVDRAWKPLYRVGGAVGLSVVVFSLIQFIAFIASPPPSTVIGYFALFHKNALLGLLDLNPLSLVNYALLIPMVLALFAALRRAGQSFMIIATTFALVGIAVYFASNTAFEMLSLSSQYEAASTDAQRSLALAAGQAMLAIYQGTAFDVSYVLAVCCLSDHLSGHAAEHCLRQRNRVGGNSNKCTQPPRSRIFHASDRRFSRTHR